METRSAVTSLSIHAVVLTLLLGLAVVTAPVQQLPLITEPRQKLKLLPYRPPSGGSASDKLPPSFGHPPPRVESRIFVPPQVTVMNLAPKLVMTAALDVPPSVESTTEQIGDPAGLGKLLSGGIGGTGGISIGNGGSIGPGSGHTYQAGRGGVTAPVPIHRVEPEYSEEARKARAMGAVLVLVDVGPDGRVHNVRIARSLGMGLDEKAVEAVSQWLFRPGTKEGHPVSVAAQIEVAFHLL